MSTWVTPAGSVGTYTRGQPLSFTFLATPTLGSTVKYLVAPTSALPPGLSLNATTGNLTGTPGFVNTDTTYSFTINAVESGEINPRIFSLTVATVTWITPAGSLGEFQEQIPLVKLFEATPSLPQNTLVYTRLNGSFPTGATAPLTLSQDGFLTGVPAQVNRNTTSTFTLRVSEYSGQTLVDFRDRTFQITISGETVPQFITQSGSLFTADDSTWISYQILYNNPDPNTTARIELVTGNLPPGLEINSSGLIRGYAQPPVTSANQPTTTTSEFTLKLSSESGYSIATFSITIKNQQLNPGFAGRAPTILNNRPQTFVIPSTDQYAPYYFTGSSIGQYKQDDNFIFKIIGYDFDGDDLTYVINGLANLGIQNEVDTGWQNGVLIEIGKNIQTYNFTARVYKTSNPDITSQTFLFTITIVGDINTQITWGTASNLGTLNNGAISNLYVYAASAEGVPLEYRIVGNDITTDMNTLIGTGLGFLAFGNNGAVVQGSQDGLTWTNSTPITSPVNIYNFTSSVYNFDTALTMLVGYDQSNRSILGQYSLSGVWSPSQSLSVYPLRKVILNDGTYVAVGDNGTLITTTNPQDWTAGEYDTGITTNLNSVCYGFGKYVAVGDNGTILTSDDRASVWVKRPKIVDENIRSVIWTGTKFVAAGDVGTLITSADAITWTKITQFRENFTCVIADAQATTVMIIGDNGVIKISYDGGSTWAALENTITTTNLLDGYYDTINTESFYLVGDAGTVLVFDNDEFSPTYRTLSSPTLSKLPNDLSLSSTGDIVGRLAFESTDQVVNQGVSKTYQFTIQAYSPEFPELNSNRSFTLTTFQKYYLPYDTLYIQAYPSLPARDKLEELLSDYVIPQTDLYRPEDPYFGRAKSVKYEHAYGVPSVATQDFYTEYLNAISINHYRRSIVLGELRVARATLPFSTTTMYEVVYSKIHDDLVNDRTKESISKQIVWPRNIDLKINNWIDSLTNISVTTTYDNQQPFVKRLAANIGTEFINLSTVDGLTVGMNLVGTNVINGIFGVPPVIVEINAAAKTVKVNVAQTALADNQQVIFYPPVYTSLTPGSARLLYPNSLPNMRQQIYDQLGQINDSSLLPAWMTSQQTDGNILGYTPAWVIAYCKPGRGAAVKARIESLWNHKTNQIDFDVDRFEVDRSKTYNYQGQTTTGVNAGAPQWGTLPSAQPSVVDNSQDRYVIFPQKTILPTQNQQ